MENSTPIRYPYKNLREETLREEVEMVRLSDVNHHIDLHSRSSSSDVNGSPSSNTIDNNNNHRSISMKTLILSCMVAAGVQFGWALQLSLLTPYIQGMLFLPSFGFVPLLQALWFNLVLVSGVMLFQIWKKATIYFYRIHHDLCCLIRFSADIGYFLGDTKEHCSTFKGSRTSAAIVVVIGFWMLDLANNTVQGPARALLADLSGPDQRNSSNAIFCSWMAVGNILGFSSGASGNWHKWFPFLKTQACCEACANLKAAFLVAVIFLALCTLITLYFAKEAPLEKPAYASDSAPLLDSSQQSVNGNLNSGGYTSGANNVAGGSKDESPKPPELKNEDDRMETFTDSPGAVLVNLLTSMRHLPPAMNSVLLVMALTWLSWFPFFLFDTDWMGREVYHGNPNGTSDEKHAYDQGVREGAFGLLLNSITYSVSFSVMEELTEYTGGGQGLAIGVLNLAIVVPQMVVPWCRPMGCSLWRRKCASYCYGIYCCPCWSYYCSYKASKACKQFLHISWYAYGLTTPPPPHHPPPPTHPHTHTHTHLHFNEAIDCASALYMILWQHW